MNATWSVDMFRWITAVEFPVLGGMFWFFWRARRESDANLAHHQARADRIVTQIRDNVAAYKLEVAKNYASIACLKDVERRLTGHLLRIEAKLDRNTVRRGDSS